jgi:phage terminase large subunit-like protein
VHPRIIEARENFSSYCSLMGKPPARHMMMWHGKLNTGQDSERLIGVAGPPTAILSPRGPLDLMTEVLTPLGWKKLRDIQHGETVYDSAGKPTRVVNVIRYGLAECWEVALSDGTIVVCDDSHGWITRSSTRQGAPWRKTTLAELRTIVREREDSDEGRKWICREARAGERPWLTKQGRPRWIVPLVEPVQRPEASLPVDPYLMGAMLARGSMSGAAVRITTDDEEVVARIEQALPIGCKIRPVSAATSVYSISGNGKKPPGVRWMPCRNPLLPMLDVLGLWGAPTWARPFPPVYQRGSVAQRVALLQGFSDTCGVVLAGGRISYSVRSPEIARGLLLLLRSLGALATIEAVGRPGRRVVSKVVASLPPSIDPFHCGGKTATYRERYGRARGQGAYRMITDIRPAGKREIGCIEVESELHEFVIRDYVPTCNSAKSTEVGLWLSWLLGRHVQRGKLLRTLYVSYNVDVARNKSKAIKNSVTSDTYREIFPMVRLSKDRTADELWSIDYDHAEIDVRGEDAFTIACAGLKGTIASKRSDLVVGDDLIKSKDSIKNPDTRREMEQNWHSVIQPTMFEGARAVMLGTRFHFDDVFATTFTEEAGWDVLLQEALYYDEAGTPCSYWPEMWSVEYLLARQQEDPINFQYQYQNRAVRDSELGMTPSLIVKGDIPEEFDRMGVGIDLSSGLRERNDYTVFLLGGVLDGTVYMIDYRRMRSMGNIEKLEAVCELLADWNLLRRDESGKLFPTYSEVTLFPEAVSYQKSFEGDFKRMVFTEWRLDNLRVSPASGMGGDKLAKFRGVMGLFQTGRVVWNRYVDWRIFVDEILNLGNSPHDDCADATQILLHKLAGRGQLELVD